MKSAKTMFSKGLRALMVVGLFGLVLGSSLIPLSNANADVLLVSVAITASPGTITNGQSATLNWSSTNATSINITPNIGSVNPYGSRGVTPSQTTTYTIIGTNSTGGYATASATVTVLQPPQTCQDTTANNYGGTLPCTYTHQPTVTLYANPTSIQSGQNSTLTWTSTHATSCSAYWTGSTATSGSGVVVPTVTTTYSITCYGASGTTPATASAVVSVNQNQHQPTVTLTANPTNINYGTASTLTWTTTNNPTSCIATGGWSGSKAIAGGNKSTGSLYGTTTFYITCSNGAGSDNAQATVTVGSQAVNGGWSDWTAKDNSCGFAGVQVRTCTNPAPANEGANCVGSSTQSYTNAQCVAPNQNNNNNTNNNTNNNNPIINIYGNGGTGNIQTCQDTSANNYGGTLPCTYTYYNQTCQDPSAINYRGTLPCNYPQIQVCQDPSAINYRGVLPCSYNNTYNYNYVNQQPTVVLYADQASVPYNGAATVRWLTTNASSCNASGGSIGWAGIKSIGPGSFYTGSLTGSKTYVITCSNNFGSATDSVSVTVRGQTITTTTNRPAPTSLVLITSSVDRNQPIVPTLDNTRPRPGDEINYTVNYQNIGTGSITGLSLRMDLPYEVDYMFSTPNNPTRSGNTLIFNLGTLKANGQGTVTVRVRVRDNIPAGTNLNFPATLSYIDPSGFPQSVTANVSAQVWSTPVVPAPVDTNANIFLGANVFGAGFLPGNLFGWLLLLILILILVLLAKYLFGQSSGQPFSSKKTTTTFDQPLGKKTTTTTVQQ